VGGSGSEGERSRVTTQQASKNKAAEGGWVWE